MSLDWRLQSNPDHRKAWNDEGLRTMLINYNRFPIIPRVDVCPLLHLLIKHTIINKYLRITVRNTQLRTRRNIFVIRNTTMLSF